MQRALYSRAAVASLNLTYFSNKNLISNTTRAIGNG